ncbi:hypothetical protein TRVA0_021S02190 [Trichomonascus vanleenenianus]|uniref:chromatin-binding protein RAD9 n=1 Tax=Trichomonascus vanleenenianus TaxID=2268995 RepID=UPI003ECB276A
MAREARVRINSTPQSIGFPQSSSPIADDGSDIGGTYSPTQKDTTVSSSNEDAVANMMRNIQPEYVDHDQTLETPKSRGSRELQVRQHVPSHNLKRVFSNNDEEDSPTGHFDALPYAVSQADNLIRERRRLRKREAQEEVTIIQNTQPDDHTNAFVPDSQPSSSNNYRREEGNETQLVQRLDDISQPHDTQAVNKIGEVSQEPVEDTQSVLRIEVSQDHSATQLVQRLEDTPNQRAGVFEELPHSRLTDIETPMRPPGAVEGTQKRMQIMDLDEEYFQDTQPVKRFHTYNGSDSSQDNINGNRKENNDASGDVHNTQAIKSATIQVAETPSHERRANKEAATGEVTISVQSSEGIEPEEDEGNVSEDMQDMGSDGMDTENAIDMDNYDDYEDSDDDNEDNEDDGRDEDFTPSQHGADKGIGSKRMASEAFVTPGRTEVGNSSPFGTVLQDATTGRSAKRRRKRVASSAEEEEKEVTPVPQKEVDEAPSLPPPPAAEITVPSSPLTPSSHKKPQKPRTPNKNTFFWVPWQEKVYPAQVLGSKGLKLVLLFGDDGEGEVDKGVNMYPLDLQPGDPIKADDDKKSIYYVRELHHQAHIGGRFTTIDGYNSVIISSKKGPPRTVALNKLYMTSRMWKDYLTKYKTTTIHSAHLFSTGSPRRKAAVKSLQQQSSLITASTTVYDNFSTQPVVKLDSRIFSKCLFSITIDNKGPKFDQGALVRMIQEHGGTILNNGLSEAIVFDELSRGTMGGPFGSFKLAATIANVPRRTSKYLEALALGWPCLATQFVLDCIAEGTLLPWQSYCLSAGRSEQLKAERSHNTTRFENLFLSGATLDAQLAARTRPLEKFSYNVKGKRDDKFKVLVFLLKALGAKEADIDPYQDEDTIEIEFDPTDDNKASYNRAWLVQTVINGRPVVRHLKE